MANSAITPESFVSPLPAGSPFTFVSAKTIYPYEGTWGIGDSSDFEKGNIYIQSVKYNGNEIFTNTFKLVLRYGERITEGEDIGYSDTLSSGVYEVTYTYKYPDLRGGVWQQITNTATYTFIVVENKLPLKPWTVTTAINRLLDICESIRKGEKPRFRLQGVNEDGSIEQGSLADKFDNITAPEWAFTKQTLRECLQDIGQVVHGEPRLIPKKDSQGKWYFEVTFDLYGQTEIWKGGK